MPAPELPTWQDCHELWSKQRRRQQREQDQQQNKAKPQFGQEEFKPDCKQDSNQSDSSFKSENAFKPTEPAPEAVGQVK